MIYLTVNSLRHICVSNVTTIDSDNGLSPCRRQAIIWTNAGILLIGPLGTNFSEILIEIHTFSFKKMHLKMSSGKWPPFCLGLNVLISVHMSKVFNDILSRRQEVGANRLLYVFGSLYLTELIVCVACIFISRWVEWKGKRLCVSEWLHKVRQCYHFVQVHLRIECLSNLPHMFRFTWNTYISLTIYK